MVLCQLCCRRVGGVLWFFVVALQFVGNLVWGQVRLLGPFWLWIVFVECTWNEYGHCICGFVIRSSLGLYVSGCSLGGLGCVEILEVVVVIISCDDQVLVVVLVNRGDQVFVFCGCLGGGHPLSWVSSSDLGGGGVFGIEVLLVSIDFSCGSSSGVLNLPSVLHLLDHVCALGFLASS